MPGVFISFEGVEGCGKSTQIQLLAESLRADGREVVVTREPGGTALGQILRKLLLEPATPLAPGAEVLMMLADRAQHIQDVIAPAFNANKIVLCDRFADSTIAYQGHGRKIDLSLLTQLNTFACGGYFPTLTFVLDVPVAEGLRRAQKRRGDDAADHFEVESVAFHERVREGFLSVARAEPERVHVLDSTRPLEVVRQEIGTAVRQRIG
ncbi:MAG: dTMP kinase [Deltaproteobacteria bacterium]|nr:dTMP kinase [Deltaproteobacteria bacterium]